MTGPDQVGAASRSLMKHPLSVAAFVLLAGVFFVLSRGCNRDALREDRPSAGAIGLGEIAFPGMQLRPGKESGAYSVVGRIRNKSATHTLRDVTLKFTMEDVSLTGDSILAASTVLTLRREVPPGRSERFRETISFGNLPAPRGRYEWNYFITAFNGRECRPPEGLVRSGGP